MMNTTHTGWTNSATPAYARSYTEAEALIARLQAALLNGPDCHDANWGHVGSLATVVEHLRLAVHYAGDTTEAEQAEWGI